MVQIAFHALALDKRSLPVVRNISNKERGGPHEKRPNLDEPSPTTEAHFKIETTCPHCTTTDTLRL
jgi:hypothetical protein